MPTVLRWKGHRFFWYQSRWSRAAARSHLEGRQGIKVWLAGGALAFNHGYSSVDLRELVAKVNEERAHLLEMWNEQFGN